MIEEFNFDELKAADRLPSPSGTALAIMKLILRDDATAQQVAQLVQSDPALSGRILRFANSAAFGARRPIASIQDAVVIMGMHSVRNFALSLSLVGNHLQGHCQNFDYQAYWSESLALAVAMAAITAREHTAAPDEAFTLGLLADIGRLALATVWPDIYSECLSLAKGDRLLALEREHFEINHEELSFLLLTDWGLPGIFLEALKISRNPALQETPRTARFARQLIFARQIARYCLADDEYKTALLSDLQREASQHGIDAATLPVFVEGIIRHWRDWGDLTNVSTDVRHAPPKSEPMVATSLNLLLIDDDTILLTRLSRQLKTQGHRVEICRDGETALKKIVDSKIDMVITDWRMQPMDGLTLCKSLRATHFGKNLYLIMLTATENEDALVEAFDAGIDDYVTKPVHLRVLLARIRAGQRIIKLQQELLWEHKQMERASAELALANRRLERIAHTDLLTGLPNRRYALRRLEQEWEAAQRFRRPLSVLMLDLDRFKAINDRLGHDAGDTALAHIARVISKAKRASDIACRLGGEEFLIIAVNTDPDSALKLGERIRFAIEKNQPQKLPLPHPITVSIGVSGSACVKLNWKELIKLSDKALYSVKQSGRNGVQIISP